MFLNMNCNFTGITYFPFILLKQQDHWSYLQLLTFIDKNPMKRYESVLETQRIDCDSFQFKKDISDETQVKLSIVLFNIKYLTDKLVVSERSHSWLHRGLGGTIKDCKLRMYSKCIHDVWQSMINDVGRRHNSDSNQIKMLKSCCHYSLRDLCVHTDDAWWKIKKYSHQKDIGKYIDGCIICLKSFFIECVSAGKTATKIMKMEGHKKNRERINSWSVHYRLFSFFDLSWSLNLCFVTIHHMAFFHEAEDTCPLIQVS